MIDSISQVARKHCCRSTKRDRLFPSSQTFRRSLILAALLPFVLAPPGPAVASTVIFPTSETSWTIPRDRSQVRRDNQHTGSARMNCASTMQTVSSTVGFTINADASYNGLEGQQSWKGIRATSKRTTANVAPLADWVGQVIICQPGSGGPYTFSGFSGGSAVSVVDAGCLSTPSMPAGNGHCLELDMIYNPLPATPELDIDSCPLTGA